MTREVVRFEPETFEQLREFAGVVAGSSLVPKAYAGKPDDVLVAFQMGAELGLRPLQALQNIAVINGRPSVWGDAMLALVLSHPECIDVRETFPDPSTARCEVIRRGRDPVVRTFSKADAVAAGLTKKPGPWQEYPNRMLAMRARGFALRDAFADALRGILSVEESRDIPPEIDITERAEVFQKPGERRADAALKAISREAPQSLTEALAAVETVGDSVNVETGEIVSNAQPAPVPGERIIPSDRPAAPATSPEELKAAIARIDAAKSIDDVNDIIDSARGFSADANRAVLKRAAQRVRELKGAPHG